MNDEAVGDGWVCWWVVDATPAVHERFLTGDEQQD